VQPTTFIDSAPDLRTMVWILSGCLGFVILVTVPAIGYFLVREFNRKDNLERRTDGFSKALTEVKDVVHELKGAIEQIRSWSTDKFVPRPEFDRAIDKLEAEDQQIREDTKQEFEKCKEYCPARGGHI
jgi:hypothetical protein